MRYAIIGALTIFIFLFTLTAIFILDSGGIKNTPEKTPAPGEAQFKTGKIRGSLSYLPAQAGPSEGIPADIQICAKDLNSAENYCDAKIIKDQPEEFTYGFGYEILVPAGTYHVYAYIPDNKENKAYYSEFVTCGLTDDCISHDPIDVKVQSGQTTAGVDPGDWYAPQ